RQQNSRGRPGRKPRRDQEAGPVEQQSAAQRRERTGPIQHRQMNAEEAEQEAVEVGSAGRVGVPEVEVEGPALRELRGHVHFAAAVDREVAPMAPGGGEENRPQSNQGRRGELSGAIADGAISDRRLGLRLRGHQATKYSLAAALADILSRYQPSAKR